MKFSLRSAAVVMASGMMLTGCVDNDYDLSDIDGTTELQVNDLVLPINIDEISMANIIDLSDTSHIKVINGEYVLIDSGTYQSDEIIVPAIHAVAPVIDPIISQITLINDNAPLSFPTIPTFPLRFEIGTQLSGFSYHVENVSDFIVDVDKIGANFDITIDLKVLGLENNVKSWTMADLTMRLPKGLTGVTNIGKYDPETGIVEIGTMKVEGDKVNFVMNVSEVDVDKAGAVFDYDKHSFTFSDVLGVNTGYVLVDSEDLISIVGLPSEADFVVEFAMTDINVDMFGGKIQYSLDGIDIADIPITGIPKVLSQDRTDISLVNPQLYVCFSNPLGVAYGLYAQTGLTLTAKRPNQPDQTYTIDNGVFRLSCDGCQGCQFCLSPVDPGQGNYFGKFVEAQHIPFTSLSQILSGNGLPRKIGVTLVDPCIPVQEINNFALGVNLGKVSGCYTIYAPLQFKDGSKVVYASTENGWWDEEMDKLSIEHLQIDALVSNDLPVDVELTGYPIDRNGDEIPGVKIEGMHLETGVEDSPLHISISGNIEHLDGVYFEAVAKSTPSELSLKPNEHIILKNVKVKVSGHYRSEL